MDRVSSFVKNWSLKTQKIYSDSKCCLFRSKNFLVSKLVTVENKRAPTKAILLIENFSDTVRSVILEKVEIESLKHSTPTMSLGFSAWSRLLYQTQNGYCFNGKRFWLQLSCSGSSRFARKLYQQKFSLLLVFQDSNAGANICDNLIEKRFTKKIVDRKLAGCNPFGIKKTPIFTENKN